VNNALVPEQFGFRKGMSIGNAVFRLTSNILNALNEKKQVEGIFCDLSKAFDCARHDILMGTLNYYGIRRKLVSGLNLT
jgi:hypothetical protein